MHKQYFRTAHFSEQDKGMIEEPFAVIKRVDVAGVLDTEKNFGK